jgi:hypothetical protein
MNQPVELADRPIFICGHPKSGTSLLRAALDGHPELIVYPEETMFFRRYLPASQALTGADRLEQQATLADQFLIQIFTWNTTTPPASQEGFLDRDYSDVSYEAVRQALRQRLAARYRHPGDMLSAVILAYGEVMGQVNPQVRGWVEKTPFDEEFAEQIFAWWPQARCIHMVRDPRDNFVSYRKKHPEWSAKVFAWSWVKSTRLGLEHQKRYGAERYWVVRYEDFVSQPAQGLEQLCRFLGIKDHATLRQPTRNGKPWKGNSMFSDSFNAISTAAVGRWQGKLAPADLALVEIIAGPLMRQLNYSLADRAPGARPPLPLWRVLREQLAAAVKRQMLATNPTQHTDTGGKSRDDEA